ncbi:MAG TPA: HDIG domain-containing protein [Candidatus Kapabacteria bacterium]|nr:HDIG domain-containing protein [Candidatus Kapabacteria bacterium]
MKNIKETLYNKIVQERLSSNINFGNSNNNSNIKYIIISITFIIISFFFVFHIENKDISKNEHRLQVGMIWEDPPLIADFAFPIYKNYEEYISQRNLESEKALPVFILDNSVKVNAIKYVNNTLNIIRDTPDIISDAGLSKKDIIFFDLMAKSQKDLSITSLRAFLLNYIDNIYNRGYVNVASDKLNNNEIIVQIGANRRYLLQTEYLIDKTIFIEQAQDKSKSILNPNVQSLALLILNKLNTPNLVFSKDLTDKNMIQAMESVPRTLGIVRAGEIIVNNGDKLSTATIQRITSYQSSKQLISDTRYGLFYYLSNIGQSAMILMILVVYLLILRKRIVNDPVQLIIIMLQLIIIAIISWFTGNYITSYPTEFFIVIPSFAMLSTIVFDSRTAFVLTLSMGLIAAGIRNNDYILSLIMLFSGTIASFTVRDIQNRTQVYQSMFFIFIAYLLSILISVTDNSLSLDIIIINILLAVVGSVIAPIITFGLLFLIENFTNFASDLRIKEYDKLDHPLLLKLSEIAPGTFQHTMSVAMLVERCAREINANPLLAKVSTYYHDIGKMTKPEYFTENQIGIGNKHDLISPKKSATIIIDHVNEGVKLAKQYNLPQRMIDFIPMHHGTTLVKHFYAKALEEVSENSIDENDFRYPGPKPRTKEAVILMICDSAEAISRIESKSISEIEQIIDNNIKDRINDGQFNESDITLKELEIIKQTIAKTIIGMTHKRVSYKEMPKDK